MAWSVIAHSIQALGVNGGTTAVSLDTRGADLIVLGVHYTQALSAVLGATNLSDVYGNTYTLISQGTGASPGSQADAIAWVAAPSVGNAHTWTISGAAMAQSYCSISIVALSGSAASPNDGGVVTFLAPNGVSVQTASLTPTVGDITIASLSANNLDTYAIDSGFTILDQIPSDGATYQGGALAYKIHSSGAEQPTWSWTNSTACAASMRAFLPLTIATQFNLARP